MGYWDTGIFGGDTACDVKDAFEDHLKNGNSPEESTRKVLQQFSKDMDVHRVLRGLSYISLLYIGLATVQMETNCLQEDVRIEAIKWIERGADLYWWGGSKYEEREKVLFELKEKLIISGNK